MERAPCGTDNAEVAAPNLLILGSGQPEVLDLGQVKIMFTNINSLFRVGLNCTTFPTLFYQILGDTSMAGKELDKIPYSQVGVCLWGTLSKTVF